MLRRLIPSGLELDTFDGAAWVGVVPFRMTGIRARGTPALPRLSAFPEINVRTYVRQRDPQDPRPGVYFFSLDAAHRLAVATARALYRLPYFLAEMDCRDDGHNIHYASRRIHPRAAAAEFRGSYRPCGEAAAVQPRCLEHWLVERYRLYTAHGDRMWAGDIHHRPWPLQPAEAEIRHNSMADAAGIALPGSAPLLHFARQLDVLIWPLRRIA